MTATAVIRGRKIYYDEYKDVWRYADTGNVAAPYI